MVFANKYSTDIRKKENLVRLRILNEENQHSFLFN